MTTVDRVVARLRSLRNERNIEGQKRFGIVTQAERLGIAAPMLRAIAREHRRDHALALALWTTGILDARALATLIDDPEKIASPQMERWARDLDNWAITDATAFLFDRTALAEAKAHAWSRRRPEFQKRLAFSMMAGMAVHRKELSDAVFLRFLPVITREATDERNFVRKAVNWALRQIGKRNPQLREAAMAEAAKIRALDSRSARWIAADALRELAAKKFKGRSPFVADGRRASPKRPVNRAHASVTAS